MSSGSSGSSGSSKTTSTSEPWKHARPYLAGWQGHYGLLPAAEKEIARNPQPFYPDQTYADFSPESMMALEGIYARGAYGSPLDQAAGGQTMDTLGGDYLSSGNPYFSAMANRIGDTTQQQLSSRFGASGRAMGSPAEKQAFTREFMNAMAPLEYGNYAQERDRMMEASKVAPILSQLDYTDLNAMRQVGAEVDAQEQRRIDEAMKRFSWPYVEPRERLGAYGNIVMGAGGLGQSGSATVQQQQPGAGPFDYASAALSSLPLMMLAF